jgi:tRNA (guanine-N7-)-methyltransferase
LIHEPRWRLFPVINLIPETDVPFLDLPELFGRNAPVHVDLGCGDGSFLRDLAAQNPDKDFLGVERLLTRVRSSERKAAQLGNLRIVRTESSFLVQHLLAPESSEAFYLLFPDPWPKRRHHRRRLITSDFLVAIWSALTSDGSFFIATDYEDYFTWIRKLVVQSGRFTVIDHESWPRLPMTTFERRFTDAGRAVYRLELRKISPVR